jgi:hypothetical protein
MSGSGGAAGNGGAAGSGVSGAGGAAGAGGGAASFVLKFPDTMVAAGDEATMCVVLDLGNDAAVHIGQIHDMLAPGVTSLTMYRSTAAAAQTTPMPCAPFNALANGNAGTPMTMSIRPDDDLVLPDGAGYSLGAHQLVRLELHAFNNSSAPVMVGATSTLTAMTTPYVREAGLMVLMDPDISIPPNAMATLGPAYLPGTALAAADIFRIEGYTHSKGTNVKLATTTGKSGPDTVVYDVAGWSSDNPPVATPSVPINVPTGGGFHLTCSWNNTSSFTVKFGNSSVSETCAALLWYAAAVPASVCVHSDASAVDVCCPGSALCASVFPLGRGRFRPVGRPKSAGA